MAVRLYLLHNIPCTLGWVAGSRAGSLHSCVQSQGYGRDSSPWCCRGRTARWRRQRAAELPQAGAASRPSGKATLGPGSHSGSSKTGKREREKERKGGEEEDEKESRDNVSRG